VQLTFLPVGEKSSVSCVSAGAEMSCRLVSVHKEGHGQRKYPFVLSFL